MMSDTETYSNPSLSMILEQQPQLYDLHTHLLGMGNAGFWIDSILMDVNVMPTHKTFWDNPNVRHDLCPLIWDTTYDTGFVHGDQAKDFFYFLIKNHVNPTEYVRDLSSKINDQFPKLSDIFSSLIKHENLNEELHHRLLCFKDHFSYDVVLTLSDLSKGLGVKEMKSNDLIQMAVVEKLGIYLSKEPIITFRNYIVFNARKQQFEIVYGIRVEDLRHLITIRADAPNEAKKVARAHIINAFSMCDAQGTPARNVDFHSFRGAFTPEFYPRRFALKDSIYSQRLDVLAALINHILKRYQTCLPPVKYCEFSVSVNDLSRPCVFDVLRSFPAHQEEIDAPTASSKQFSTCIYGATEKSSSFAQCVLDNHFPHLKVAYQGYDGKNGILPCAPNVVYKFLVGFDRQKVKPPLLNNQSEALSFLNDSPQRAIQIMLDEIENSKRLAPKSEPFAVFLEQLEELRKKDEKMLSFYFWVVGIDLFADEYGYPYCPFVARSFIKYIQDQRENNPWFGVRIHCGENVPFADVDSPAYRLFIAHMYIVFRCLHFLQQELTHGIRIGHGIAFERVLGSSMSTLTHRKSSVLLAEMRHHAKRLFKTIAFEVNITSNEYLVRDTLRQGDFIQTHCLEALFALEAPIILATDDDGIWPIDRCPCSHPGHHSLAAEYCRAILSRLIPSTEKLTSILTATKNFCFLNMRGTMQENKDILPIDDISAFAIIIHPEIIKLILHRCDTKQLLTGPYYNHYIKTYPSGYSNVEANVKWNDEFKSLARVAYVCFCMYNKETDKKEMDEINWEYDRIFEDDEDKSRFEFIRDNWSRIRSAFVSPNAKMDDSQQGPFALMTDGKHLYFSLSHINTLSNCLHYNRFRQVTICAFTRNLDVTKTTDDLNNQLPNENEFKNISLTIFTNEDKDKYTYYKMNNRLKLQVNPNPDRKGDTNKFFYVLCPHSGAATAALHFIADQLLAGTYTSTSQTIAVPQTASDANDINFGKTSTTDQSSAMPAEIEIVDNDNAIKQTTKNTTA